MCGEHLLLVQWLPRPRGSSPHVRGTHRSRRDWIADIGIIPACAGNTRTMTVSVSLQRDHPRMCGEHCLLGDSLAVGLGSSPHVRGTPFRVTEIDGQIGIIPACAGNTSSIEEASRRTRDHPRMCGEHAEDKTEKAFRTGSSPHVRGTRIHLMRCAHSAGIIPACAGNTSSAILNLLIDGDHPRMCGEHCASALPLSDGLGSSPHVRGTLDATLIAGPVMGIIPACAGNTKHLLATRPEDGDHPRMCGEHTSPSPPHWTFPGSSPHVRGTPIQRGIVKPVIGIIPACAGNTGIWRRMGCRVWDHPRMCGEHFNAPEPMVFSWGSSPHVRGTLRPRSARSRPTGIIPACAGNTGTSRTGR